MVKVDKPKLDELRDRMANDYLKNKQEKVKKILKAKKRS